VEHLSDPFAQVLLAVLTPTGTALALLVMLRSFIRSRLRALARLEKQAEHDRQWRMAMAAKLSFLRAETLRHNLNSHALKSWLTLYLLDPARAKQELPQWAPANTLEEIPLPAEPERKDVDDD
jgi:hypothetical protein